MYTIYRVENSQGDGCYRVYSNIKRWICKRHKDGCQHPTPILDNGINRSVEPKEICGFKDFEQSKNWFNKWELLRLWFCGFRLKQVEVKEITAYGDKQVLAIR